MLTECARRPPPPLLFLLLGPRPPRSTLFPYTTLFRSQSGLELDAATMQKVLLRVQDLEHEGYEFEAAERSEEHTSELQSHLNLVCRLLLEKKKLVPDRREHRNDRQPPHRPRRHQRVAD